MKIVYPKSKNSAGATKRRNKTNRCNRLKWYCALKIQKIVLVHQNTKKVMKHPKGEIKLIDALD